MPEAVTLAGSPETKGSAPALLQVDDLRVHFPFHRGPIWRRHWGVIRAVDGVSFVIKPGETLALVGESGSGKTTTARAIVGLAPITAGTIRYRGQLMQGAGAIARHQFRRSVQMIFQDPFSSLNPRLTVGQIIAEPLHIFGLLAKGERRLEAMRLMEQVGLNPRLVNRYPHEFSGGQRQRIVIARGLALQPKLLVCDEPVSALDVSIQAQILNLLSDLQQRLGLAYLLIAHDLAVVRHLAQRLAVMYLGRLVETGPTDVVFRDPQHPYTRALLSAVPVPDPVIERQRQRVVLKGEIPSPEIHYAGCPLAERCPWSDQKCVEHAPQLVGLEHQASCWHVDQVTGRAAPDST
jgi:oligopeptide transport system ATP-binding protein